MAATQLLNVQNTDIEVKKYAFSKKELDLDSGRNLNGVMERTILAHHPRTIDIILPPCDRTQMHNYMVLFDRPEITVKGFDIFTNQIETIICMHGDLSPEIYWNPDEMLYNEMPIQLVEY
jgi:hypothetical protein